MFPWSGLVPIAVLGARKLIPADATRAQRDVARIGTLWFLMAFALFSAMATKFHHYIFPAIPGAAMVLGIVRLPRKTPRAPRRALVPLVARMLLVALGVARALGGLGGHIRPGALHVGSPTVRRGPRIGQQGGVARLVVAHAAQATRTTGASPRGEPRRHRGRGRCSYHRS
ncbi:MAG: hypothetical protein U0325_20080 [Polyangiales bacterium]